MSDSNFDGFVQVGVHGRRLSTTPHPLDRSYVGHTTAIPGIEYLAWNSVAVSGFRTKPTRLRTRSRGWRNEFE